MVLEICILIVVIVILVFGLIIWALQYNIMVSLSNRCTESWADVDVELKRRYDLIPVLVRAVKAYTKHERVLLQSVTEIRELCMRSRSTPGEKSRIESQLQSALDQLLMKLEAYPNLKASPNFLKLQKELSETEDRIAAARRFYNANVRELNIRTEQFPSNIVAKIHGFTKKEYFKVEDRSEAISMQEPVPVRMGIRSQQRPRYRNGNRY